MKAFFENRKYNPDVPLTISVIKSLDFVAHWHTDLEVIYVCEGSIGVGINREYRVLGAGDISVCGSNDIHYYESEGLSSTIILLIFRPDLLNSFKNRPAGFLPCSIFIEQDPNLARARIKEILYSLLCEMEQKRHLYPLFADLRIEELFLTLFRYLPSYYEDSRKNNQNFEGSSDIKHMQKAIKYLEENYAQEISLEQISKEVNLSRFYFSRLFHKTTGMNFNAYLNRIRIEKAEELIRNTKKPIITIAYETGFLSIRTFNRLFRTIRGCAPQSLRQA